MMAELAWLMNGKACGSKTLSTELTKTVGTEGRLREGNDTINCHINLGKTTRPCQQEI